jgi:hypothetical protein
MSDDYRCPRCGGQVPNALSPGAYPGAQSRTDGRTEVCSRCGSEEGMQALTLGACTPQGRWPVSPDGPGRAQMAHVDYPHEPGFLYDCPACEAMPGRHLDDD